MGKTPHFLTFRIFCFTASSFEGVLHQWQAQGIARYRAHFPADGVLLVLYGAFGFAYGRQRVAAQAAHRAVVWLLVWSLPFAALSAVSRTQGVPVCLGDLVGVRGIRCPRRCLALIGGMRSQLGEHLA